MIPTVLWALGFVLLVAVVALVLACVMAWQKRMLAADYAVAAVVVLACTAAGLVLVLALLLAWTFQP